MKSQQSTLKATMSRMTRDARRKRLRAERKAKVWRHQAV